MRPVPKAPAALADKEVQAARVVADNDLAAEAAPEEVAERSLVAAVVELGAAQEVVREANSAAELAAVFFASK
jgi:hypothetical protein